MSDTKTIEGLLAKRKAMVAAGFQAESTLRQIVLDLRALDTAIRMFDPNVELEEIKPKPLPPRHQAVRGEISQIVLDALKSSKSPMCASHLAEAVIAARGLPKTDQDMRRRLRKRMTAAMKHYQKQGLVEIAVRKGATIFWVLAADRDH